MILEDGPVDEPELEKPGTGRRRTPSFVLFRFLPRAFVPFSPILLTSLDVGHEKQETARLTYPERRSLHGVPGSRF